MKRLLLLILSVILYCSASAQQFIKTFDEDYGVAVRVLPTNDNGWVIFTMDSMKLTKFNNCGVPLWSKQYFIPNSQQGLYDFIKTSDDGFALLTRMAAPSLHPNFAIHVALVTKIDAQGNLIWSKSYEDPTSDYTQYPYTMNEDLQGNLVVFCGTGYHIASNPAYNMILKVDANGILLSNRFYDFGGIWGGAIVTSDNGVLIRTGSTFIKTDNAGNVQWTSSFAPSGNYFAPVEVADGYIFTGYKTTSNSTSFFKMSKQGNLMWGGRRETSFTGMPNLVKKNNGNFAAVFVNGVIEFDKDLNVMERMSFNSGTGLFCRSLCYLNDNTSVLAGLQSSGLFYAKLNNSYQTNCTFAPTVLITPFNDVNQNNFNLSYQPYNITVVPQVNSVDSFSITVELICTRALELGLDTLLCHNAPFLLRNIFQQQFETYLWSTNETTPEITVANSDTFWLQVTYNCGQDSLADTINVVFETPINVDLGSDVPGCENESHVFTATHCDSCLYLWSDGTTADTLMVQIPGNYWLQVTDSNGCIYSDTVNYFTSKCECQLYLPNSFTPNNDGKNEIFMPLYYCDLADFNMQIFNRWGQSVYSTNNVTESWNGRYQNNLVPSGVYFYAVNYTPILKGQLNKTLSRTGSVTIIY